MEKLGKYYLLNADDDAFATVRPFHRSSDSVGTLFILLARRK
ncbi:hypothetical protein HMPREF0372_04265 [Flavonifractor plautii ATCC 29863]|uniref:Uncharacterized protein n=1 Tax=Flavonifractor plautii ATCC 29863 TaxID=411475 RepID=G9YXJ7_FLAPL|nr:hypothetical protein HMPREF0372_04265 [Flavonifractor plautii ATCC 29863]